jgi:hypothetical protein
MCDECRIGGKRKIREIYVRPSEKIITVRGENILKDKIILVKSCSPYARKITIRY